MPLTDMAIRKAAPDPEGRRRRVHDSAGLYLEVAPSGGKWWRFKYTYAGKEKRVSLGTYPEVPLAGFKDKVTGKWVKGARELRDDCRKQVAQGVDPSLVRRSEKATRRLNASNDFESVAREWFESRKKEKWSEGHAENVLGRLERDVFPWIGRTPIADVDAPLLLETLRRVEERGAIETAHRELQICSQVFRYAIVTHRATRDPSADLRGALRPHKEKHHASVKTPKAVGALLRAINGYEGHLITKCALRLAPLVFVRPGELRHAEWDEFDFAGKEWRIPGEKMKRGILHIVPLSTQAIAILKEIEPLTARNGEGKYVFPGMRSHERPMSENTVNAALRRLGFTTDEMTGHGFRSIASTFLNEHGWKKDAIERQLAHIEGNSVRAAYNFAEHLPERREMMQAWADHLELLTKADGGREKT